MAEELTVWARRRWNHWEEGLYRLADLRNVRWDTYGGGWRSMRGWDQVAPQPFLHAYVMCDAALEGGVAHSCPARRRPTQHQGLYCGEIQHQGSYGHPASVGRTQATSCGSRTGGRATEG